MRTGDHVRVAKLDEEWIVAKAEDGWITCAGWPETIVPESDCVLIKACSDDEHLAMLLSVASSDGPRGAYARRVLAERKEPRP